MKYVKRWGVAGGTLTLESSRGGPRSTGSPNSDLRKTSANTLKQPCLQECAQDCCHTTLMTLSFSIRDNVAVQRSFCYTNSAKYLLWIPQVSHLQPSRC